MAEAEAAQCGACNKAYSSQSALRKHWVRQPLCAAWLELQPGLKDYVDAAFALPAIEPERASNAVRCGVCSTTFANVGNLNRHQEANVICGKWAKYQDLRPLLPYVSGTTGSTQLKEGPSNGSTTSMFYAGVASDGTSVYRPVDVLFDAGTGSELDSTCTCTRTQAPFSAPAYSLCHIIWNVFLIDKEFCGKHDMAMVCRDNNIKYVIAILPRETPFQVPNTEWGVEHAVLPYDGHDTTLDTAAFDVQCEEIESRRARREYVAVFCNSGYQRSLPFLCHYLVRHHPDEVPTVERAIDTILPQVDKANFAAQRDEWIRKVQQLQE
jgi:hypothetical protein